ncbi:MAG: RIP metalloprotease RseP [Anaerovoracaceae bacterium]
MTIIYAILMFCILIFIHELGHFAAAKACGVKVNEFALGMGPTIVSKQKGETKYSLRAIPIGGFCAMEGEDEESNDDRAFNNKKAWQKTIIVIAGSFMNVLLALILITIVVYNMGFPSTTIANVQKDSPAYHAGIQVGDKITSVNGTKINEWQELSVLIKKDADQKTVNLGINRDGKNLVINSELKKAQDGRMVMGVLADREKNIGKSIINGPKATLAMTKDMYGVLKKLVTGEVSTKELSGPVGIVYMVDKSAEQGFITVLYFMALISLNLGIVNMLPLPALDGGRLVFIIIRKITGQAITDEMEGRVHIAGMVLLLTLMLYVTWNDIFRFIVPVFK